MEQDGSRSTRRRRVDTRGRWLHPGQGEAFFALCHDGQGIRPQPRQLCAMEQDGSRSTRQRWEDTRGRWLHPGQGEAFLELCHNGQVIYEKDAVRTEKQGQWQTYYTRQGANVMRITGRRNALGSLLEKRSDAWQNGTARVFSVFLRSNTDTSPNMRLPSISQTHDPACTSKCCEVYGSLQRICRLAQRAQRQTTGYFSGYIVNRQLSY